MIADTVLGSVDDPVFADRRRHHVDIGWGDAGKHRQLVTADTGIEVRIMLPRGAFLRHGAVIADDGGDVVVVRRPAEPAIRVRFADNSARAMLLLGHLLGNQHAPVDVDEDAVTVPLFTSADAAREMLAGIGVVGEVIEMALAGHGWARTSADDHAGHHH
ncbi:urease accessory protein UreE [Mycolicibacterium bacteremicum]|uniref:Urease accessory protein UreE n=1 Tax=Mycolicibacterium bacteremicum TaxID=564198 RepID=A0A1W9YW40_MYCBA|nr:urease accessory protein UreE [Mycolicibacterium bacteremicum]MCV7430556.1 urease accessory protein UreE [Mycolicibacterium bacteremicum]ORA04152.1 urease accessory protein UreE [Mycolicibacterium bacteremicum]